MILIMYSFKSQVNDVIYISLELIRLWKELASASARELGQITKVLCAYHLRVHKVQFF